MNDLLEQMIEDSLARHATDVRPGRRLDPATVLAAAGRARHRRTGVLAAAAAAVALGVAAVAVLPPAAPRPGNPLSAGPLDVLSVGHGVIVRGGDGKRVRIDSLDASHVTQATRVPGGWVAEADLSPTLRRLLFVSPSGSTKTITAYASDGGYVLSPDGDMIVVTRVLGDPTGARTIAYPLSSLDRPVRLVNWHIPGPPLATDGAQVLLFDDLGFPGYPLWRGAVWNLDTGSVVLLQSVNLAMLGASTRGDVLFAWATMNPAGEQVGACVIVVPMSDLQQGSAALRQAEDARTTCRPVTTMPTGTISPDGTEVFIDGPAGFRGMYRVADLRAGGAAAIPLPSEFDGYHAGYGLHQPWVRTGRGTSVVLDATGYRYAACDPTGDCTPIAMPDGLDHPVPVAHVPG